MKASSTAWIPPNSPQKGRDGVGVNKRTGAITGGGAAIGAIIGAIAGGGKGAAIGAGAGAGAGAVGQILTKGSIKIPAETILTFRLDGPCGSWKRVRNFAAGLRSASRVVGKHRRLTASTLPGFSA